MSIHPRLLKLLSEQHTCPACNCKIDTNEDIFDQCNNVNCLIRPIISKSNYTSLSERFDCLSFYFKINNASYKIWCNYFCDEMNIYGGPGQKLITTIKSIPELDFNNYESLTNKIKLLLAFV